MYQSIYKYLPVFVILLGLLSGNVLAQSFITTWQIDNPGDQITIPTTGSGYNYDVDWGDTMSDTGVSGNITHMYAVPGTYTVAITGDFPRIYFNGFSSPSRNQILSVEQWGSISWASMNSAFQGCSNLIINAPDAPNLTNVTDMTEMFRGATSFNQDISGWNVSNVTNMTSTFSSASSFNQSLDSWNVSAVTDMTSMFASALVFNGQIGTWNVGNVTDMDRMFETARDFNQNIGSWNVSQVIDMTRMFRSANSFNQNIAGWNPVNVTSTQLMFSFASAFNQAIGSWNVGSVTDMSNMFSPASVFNQNIDAWDVSNVTTMREMFNSANEFNQPLNSWDVGSVTDMRSMFASANEFNQDLNSWDVSNVTNMSSMFNSARSFNGAIGNWDVSSVTTMNSMFRNGSDFNQNINSWNVSNVTNMGSMFGLKGSYDQPLNLWDVANVANMNSMFVFTTFNEDITMWNVGSVVDFGSIFANTTIFNQDISGWDVSSATSTDDMFRSCAVFNQDISGWDVSNVVNMGGMFDRAEVFNQDISGWDVSSIMFTFSTFSGATAFDQDLSSWDISNVINVSNMLSNSGLSAENYDNALVGWSALPLLQPNLTLGAIGLNYCTAETERNSIIATYGWTIADEGLGCPAGEIATFDGPNNTFTEILDGQTTIINFGIQAQGTGINRTFVIENQGNALLTVTNISSSGSEFILNSPLVFPLAIPPGGSQLLDILLTANNAGVFTETITTTSDDADEASFNFDVTGTITSTPQPEITAFFGPDLSGSPIFDGQVDAVNFGNTPQSTNITRQITIENIGTANLDLNTLSFSPAGIFFIPSTPATTIAPGLFETIDIEFDASNVGMFSATFEIDNNDLDETIFSFEVTAEATTPPVPEIVVFKGIDVNSSTDEIFNAQTSSIDLGFSTQGIDIVQPITIANIDAGDLNVFDITVSGTVFSTDASTPFIIGGFVDSDVPVVTFNLILSGANSGSFNETITITNDDPDESSFIFPVSGEITPTNSPPIITGQELLSTPVNTPIDLPLASFTVTDVDNTYPTGFSLVISQGQNYTASGNTVTPDSDFVGNLTVPIVISDGNDNSPLFNVVVSVIEGELEVDFDGQALASGSVISFDDIPVGAEDNRELVITNTGVNTLVITDVKIEGEDFRLNSPIPDPILAGADSPISIIFQPTSIGSKTAILTVSSASVADFTATLTASGLSEAPALEIFNVVSVQQNGKHDFLEIRNIEFYNANRVFIYNRWGNEVYKTNDYDNTANHFSGNSDNGKELPDGTYYYVIELNGGETVQNGFFLLRR